MATTIEDQHTGPATAPPVTETQVENPPTEESPRFNPERRLRSAGWLYGGLMIGAVGSLALPWTAENMAPQYLGTDLVATPMVVELQGSIQLGYEVAGSIGVTLVLLVGGFLGWKSTRMSRHAFGALAAIGSLCPTYVWYLTYQGAREEALGSALSAGAQYSSAQGGLTLHLLCGIAIGFLSLAVAVQHFVCRSRLAQQHYSAQQEKLRETDPDHAAPAKLSDRLLDMAAEAVLRRMSYQHQDGTGAQKSGQDTRR